ncbi:putative aldo-keto reductase (AKR13) [Sporothrix brasiliensis 5110]|uniref:Putative aldo-keto reductase (AKR13) n=1 Tax=Sporothrix brasiliensis 5110 TaxID=1398154 RepID=A0A0C2J4U3_9PEZI|nr:putative aldo-keto reductase (AKR13) [Sporothrix brasiliensis 5110]KIH94045.1 putative aldo-keto reductase (AKR13) [Sporothrix brasiliensis 5110]
MTSSITSRPLGKNGPMLPRLGLGRMNNSGAYNAVGSDEERLGFLDRAYAMGERFWDTADMYLDSEDLPGQWFARNPEKRAHVFLATKFSIDMTVPTDIIFDSSPAYARQQLARSLTRLGVAYIDLYYVHRLDGKTPIETTMAALVALKNEGKIKHIGLGACSAASLRRAHAVHPIAAVQTEYSVFARAIEAVDDPKRGILAAAPRAGRGRRREGNLDANVATVAQMGALAKQKGVTTAQLCLAWLLAQGDDVFAIPGTRKAERLQENLAALRVELTAEEQETLGTLGKQVAGGESRPEHVAIHFADTPEL